jgi:hypothetical protein
VSFGGCLAAAGHAELGQDVRHMHAGGLGGDEELGGDLRVRPPGGDEAQYLGLPGRETPVAQVVAVTPVVTVVAGEGDPCVVRQRRDLVAERARANRVSQPGRTT